MSDKQEIFVAAVIVTLVRYIFSSIVLLTVLVSESSTGQSSSISPRGNAEQLKIGRFRYRTLVNGKDGGTSEISISKSSANIFYLYQSCERRLCPTVGGGGDNDVLPAFSETYVR